MRQAQEPGWVEFIDTKLGFTLGMDTTKHTTEQIIATFKVLIQIAEIHKHKSPDDRPEDSSTEVSSLSIRS